MICLNMKIHFIKYILGEKYLGAWHNNTKHGNGLIVTLDGIYFEGTFFQDVFLVIHLSKLLRHRGKIFLHDHIIDFVNSNLLNFIISGTWHYGS